MWEQEDVYDNVPVRTMSVSETRSHHAATVIQRAWRAFHNTSLYLSLELRNFGHEVLGGRKQRRRHSLVSMRRFVGDYLNYRTHAGLQITLADYFKHEIVIMTCYCRVLVHRTLRAPRLHPNILVVTNVALYFLHGHKDAVFDNVTGAGSTAGGQTGGEAPPPLVLHRRLILSNMEGISVSKLQDDWIVLHANPEPDVVMEVHGFCTELVTTLCYHLRGQVPLDVTNEIRYCCKFKGHGRRTLTFIIDDGSHGLSPLDQLRGVFKKGKIFISEGENPKCVQWPSPSSRPSFNDAYQDDVPVSSIGDDLYASTNPRTGELLVFDKDECFYDNVSGVEEKGDDAKPARLKKVVTIKYEAIYPYTAAEPRELSFEANEVMDVVQKSSAGWFLCSIGEDRVGWVPSNYLRELCVKHMEVQMKPPKQLIRPPMPLPPKKEPSPPLKPQRYPSKERLAPPISKKPNWDGGALPPLPLGIPMPPARRSGPSEKYGTPVSDDEEDDNSDRHDNDDGMPRGKKDALAIVVPKSYTSSPIDSHCNSSSSSIAMPFNDSFVNVDSSTEFHSSRGSSFKLNSPRTNPKLSRTPPLNVGASYPVLAKKPPALLPLGASSVTPSTTISPKTNTGPTAFAFAQEDDVQYDNELSSDLNYDTTAPPDLQYDDCILVQQPAASLTRLTSVNATSFISEMNAVPVVEENTYELPCSPLPNDVDSEPYSLQTLVPTPPTWKVCNSKVGQDSVVTSGVPSNSNETAKQNEDLIEVHLDDGHIYHVHGAVVLPNTPVWNQAKSGSPTGSDDVVADPNNEDSGEPQQYRPPLPTLPPSSSRSPILAVTQMQPQCIRPQSSAVVDASKSSPAPTPIPRPRPRFNIKTNSDSSSDKSSIIDVGVSRSVSLGARPKPPPKPTILSSGSVKSRTGPPTLPKPARLLSDAKPLRPKPVPRRAKGEI